MKKLITVIGLLFALGGMQAIMAGELKVGAAAVNLVADDSMVIAGSILPKTAKGQEGELRAIAVVMEEPRLGLWLAMCCSCRAPWWILPWLKSKKQRAFLEIRFW